MWRCLGILLLACLSGPMAQAMELNTDQISVQFPPSWSCDLDGSSFLCSDKSEGRQKSAVVLIHQKIAGPAENMDLFRTQLKAPKSPKGKDGTPVLSRLVSFQDRSIQGQTWVEALHFEGELPEFFTYYLATRKGNHAFLVTLSAHQSQWEKYRPVFEKIIDSMQVFGNAATDTLDANIRAGKVNPDGSPIDPLSAEQMAGGDSGLFGFAHGLSPAKIFLMVAVVAACLAGLYFFKT